MSDNMPLVIRGRVIAKMGESIDTDAIYPGRFLNVTDRDKTAEHLFELTQPELRKRIKGGDVIVAGKNFGCGSSREQATSALRYAGIGAVVAVSFSRIFYRNCINLGLAAVVCAEAVASVRELDELQIDLERGWVRNLTRGEVYAASKLDPRAVELLQAGGLVPYLKAKRAQGAGSVSSM